MTRKQYLAKIEKLYEIKLSWVNILVETIIFPFRKLTRCSSWAFGMTCSYRWGHEGDHLDPKTQEKWGWRHEE